MTQSDPRSPFRVFLTPRAGYALRFPWWCPCTMRKAERCSNLVRRNRQPPFADIAAEIVIVDDASTDETRARPSLRCKDEIPALRVIWPTSKNAGQSRAVRTGILGCASRPVIVNARWRRTERA